MKKKIFSEFDLNKNVDTNPGSIYETTYELRYDDEGVSYLEPVGKENIQAKINSYLAETDLNLIVARLVASGIDPQTFDVSFSDKVLDVSKVPKNLTEVMNSAINKENNESLIKQYEAKIKALKEKNNKVKEENENE